MRPFTAALVGLVGVLVLASAFFFTHLHGEHLHHVSAASVQLITKSDHDRFLREGIHCDETYETQGYEGPESLLRMFTLTQHEFQELNPGVSLNDPRKGTVVCVKGKLGDASQEAFHWFWPVTGLILAALGAAFSWVIRTKVILPRANAGAAAGTKAPSEPVSQA